MTPYKQIDIQYLKLPDINDIVELNIIIKDFTFINTTLVKNYIIGDFYVIFYDDIDNILNFYTHESL